MNIDCYNGIDDYTVAGHEGYWKVSEVVREDSKWWNKPDTTFYLYNESSEKLMTTTPPIPVRKYRTKEYITTMKDHIAKCCGNVWGDVLEDELVISGGRQTGKTTAVKEVIKDLEERGITVYVDTFSRLFGQGDYQFERRYRIPFVTDLKGYDRTGKMVVIITDEVSSGEEISSVINVLYYSRVSKIIPIKIWTPR
jgi:hypothetical protein